jgi:hypothetical protein
MNKTNNCPVTGCFCWKNPLQLAGFLALLPFAVKGAVWAWNAVTAAVTALGK